ncbi:MAG: proline--tRNA ligase, partial [Candidatus Marinimicrobia bacterium]|nr:proline--tRNA ligase [Candidatus Neomarinimicrobiota bacterium]
KDLDKKQVVLVRRDTGNKQFIPIEKLSSVITNLLQEIQNSLFQRALEFRNNHTHEAENYEDFKKIISDGGFVKAFWAGDGAMEATIQEETKATIRCIPFKQDQDGVCFYTGKPSKTVAIFAKSY